ncbi:uncharacterized protein LOC144863057 [Branchiostoma floridae x Branchiostoma japonicum]
MERGQRRVKIRTMFYFVLFALLFQPTICRAGGWVETDPTWVTPDEWLDDDGVRRLSGYVLDNNFKTTWRRGDDEVIWHLTFDLQESMKLSRIRIWFEREVNSETGKIIKRPEVTVLRLTGQRWTVVSHFRGELKEDALTNRVEFDLTGLLAAGQWWRLQFPRENRRAIIELAPELRRRSAQTATVTYMR